MGIIFPQVRHLTAKETEAQRNLRPCYSQGDFWTSSISSTWEFVGSAESRPHLKTYCVRTCSLTRFSGDSNAHSFLEALLSDHT